MSTISTIAQGVASSVTTNTQTTPNTAQANNPAGSTQQTHQNLQASAQAATTSLQVKDKDRAPQIPKRVEGTYSPIKKKKKPAKQAKEEEREEEAEQESLNLTA